MLACVALGSTIGLVVAAWGRPTAGTPTFPRESRTAVESPSKAPEIPACCSEAGSSRSSRLGPGRSGVSVSVGEGGR
jgi:hypothetical protein